MRKKWFEKKGEISLNDVKGDTFVIGVRGAPTAAAFSWLVSLFLLCESE